MHEQDKAVTEAAAQIIKESMDVRWYWIAGELEVEQPGHECTADCEHWKEKT